MAEGTGAKTASASNRTGSANASSIANLAATVTAVAIQSQPDYFPQFKDLDNPDAVTQGISVQTVG